MFISDIQKKILPLLFVNLRHLLSCIFFCTCNCQEGWLGARREKDDTPFKWVDDSSEVLLQSTEDSFANWYGGRPQSGKHCMSGIYNRDGNHCPSGGFFNLYEPGMINYYALLHAHS